MEEVQPHPTSFRLGKDIIVQPDRDPTEEEEILIEEEEDDPWVNSEESHLVLSNN